MGQVGISAGLRLKESPKVLSKRSQGCKNERRVEPRGWSLSWGHLDLLRRLAPRAAKVHLQYPSLWHAPIVRRTSFTLRGLPQRRCRRERRQARSAGEKGP